MDDVTGDNTVNADEAAGNVTVTGRVTGEYTEGDVVTLTINGNDNYTTTVNAVGNWSVVVAGSDLAADADQTIDGVIAATDAAGNVGNIRAEKEYGVAPTITINSDVLSGLDVLVDETGLRESSSVSSTTDFSKALSAGYAVGKEGVVSYQLGLTAKGETPPVLKATQSGEDISLVMSGGNIVGLTKSGDTAFEVSVDQSGKVTLTQHMAIHHPDPTRGDEVLPLRDAGIRLIVKATEEGSNALSAQAEITLGRHLKFEDDGVTLTQNADGYKAIVQDVPVILNGQTSLNASGAQNHTKLSFNGFSITAQGFKSATDSTLTEAKVYQTSSGLGVNSNGSPYHKLPGEIDYRHFSNGTSASEKLIIKLDAGKLAFGLSAEFGLMYGGELERGKALFYREGKLIEEKEFSSDANSGSYAANFKSVPGGFDEVHFVAIDNGKPMSHGDNSDYALKSINFNGEVTGQVIASAKGQVLAESADGIRGFSLEGLTNNFGYTVSVVNDGSSLVARDSQGNKVFGVELSKTQGTWDFVQYKAIPEDIQFKIKAVDGDGDSAITTVSLDAYAGATPEVDVAITAESVVIPDISKANISRLGAEGSGVVNGSAELVEKSETFSFGTHNAGKTFTLSWTQQAFGGWEDDSQENKNNGYTADRFYIYDHSGKQLNDKSTYSLGQPGGSNNNYASEKTSHSAQVTLDSEGKAEIKFVVASTDSAETMTISDIKATLPSTIQYSVTLDGHIDDGEIANYLVEVTGGKLLQNGKELSMNADGQYMLTSKTGLTVAPTVGAKEVQVSAEAVSKLGVHSEVDTAKVGITSVLAIDNVNEAKITAETIAPSETKPLIAKETSYHSTSREVTDDYLSKSFTVSEGGKGRLEFSVDLSQPSSLLGSTSASVLWQLNKQDAAGDYKPVDGKSGVINSSVVGRTIDGLAEGNYKIYFAARTSGSTGWFGTGNYSSATIKDVNAIVQPKPYEQVKSAEVQGNVLTDLGIGSKGDVFDTNATTLKVWNGTQFVDTKAAGTSVAGKFGNFTLEADGDYTYSPDAKVANVGKIDTLTYQLVHTDGSTSEATLRVGITGPGVDSFKWGSEGSDTLDGDAGNNVLVGGGGNDTLYGGAGADTFKWEFGDQGTSKSAAIDQVMDFTVGKFGADSQADRLDLADLLQGENSGNIDQYIHAEQQGSDTVLHVKSNGGLASDGSNADQRIVMKGVDMHGSSSSDFIQSMLEHDQLKIE
ncbi:DUF5801 repeats-in-toxin domain-containing protein [Vreelandella zhanjiangensis]|uniref:DUF5801 repeats-in-toxin domain-containing protein n=1 Tax=Vreelandella zhanjiangensis TaxID=1121960 RepID=UPI00402AD9FA